MSELQRYTTLRTGLWTDRDFDKWRSDSFLLFVYLCCNDHDNGLTGIYRASDRTIRTDTRLSPRRLEKAWEQVTEKVERFENGWIWIRGRGYNIKSDDQCTGAWRYLQTVPARIRAAFLKKYPTIDPSSTPPPTPPRPPPVSDTETDTVTDTETDNRDYVSLVRKQWNEWVKENGLKNAAHPFDSDNPRYGMIKARCKKKRWLEDFTKALERAKQSDFLMGRLPNLQWQNMTLDFIIRPGRVGRILEGQFDGKRSGDESLISKAVKNRDKRR